LPVKSFKTHPDASRLVNNNKKTLIYASGPDNIQVKGRPVLCCLSPVSVVLGDLS